MSLRNPSLHGSVRLPDPSGRDVPGGPRRTRRLAILALAVLAVVVVAALALRAVLRDPGDERPGRAAGTVLRVTPVGTGDGTSWESAAGLADVPRLVAGLPRGGEVWLRADAGPYDVGSTLRMTAGGAAGAPVVVRGVDTEGRPAKAVLRGDRTSPYSPDGKSGGDVFSLRGGADHLVFRDLAFADVGNVFLAAGDVDDVGIEDTSARNVRRFFENARTESEDSADVTGLTLRRVEVLGFSKRVVRLRYASSDVLLEDVVGDSQMQDGDDFAIGVHLEDEVHDVVLRRVAMRNTRDTLREYWNGDGFATERGVHDVAFEDTSASGNTDAGYDLKSSRTTLLRATAADNKRNFRFWSPDLTGTDLTGLDPRKRGGNSRQAQVWLGEGAQASLTDSDLRSSDPETVVFDLEPGARLTVVGGSVAQAGELQRTQERAAVELRDVAR